jgi:hypothetical protein
MTNPSTIAKGLTEHDKRVLLTMHDGKDRIGGWGAWVGEVKSHLRRNRLAVLSGNTLILTDLGRAVVAELEGE